MTETKDIYAKEASNSHRLIENISKNVELTNRIIQLEKDLKYIKHQNDFDLNDLRSKYEEKIKKFKEEEIKSSLNYDLISNENQMLKNEMLNLKLSKNDLEEKIRQSAFNLEQSHETTKLTTDQLIAWKSKFKDFTGKLNEAEKIELKIRNKVNVLTEENQSLKLLADNHKAAMNLLDKEKNEKIKRLEECLNEKSSRCDLHLKQLESLNIQNDNLTELINQLKDKNQKLNTEIEELNQNKNELENQLVNLHQTISSNAKSLVDLDTLNKNLENNLKEKELNLINLQKEKEDLQKEINNLKLLNEINVTELKNRIIEIEDLNLIEQNKNECLKTKIADLEEEIYIYNLTTKELIEERNKVSHKKHIEVFTQTLPNKNLNKLTQTDKIQFHESFTQTNDQLKSIADLNKNIIESNNNVVEELKNFDDIESIDLTQDDFLVFNKPKTSKSTISIVSHSEKLKCKNKSKLSDDVYEKYASTLVDEDNQDIPRTKKPNCDIYKNKNYQYKSDNQALNEFLQNNLENYITKGMKNMSKIRAINISTKESEKNSNQDKAKLEPVKRVRFNVSN